ncbi:CatA-like O-acetyltransferase [uncultured Akkermansia sp.]|uniref:CatA-like O-acetyltransferase n=1 Tax=uncultured Akkermansia sp. TaxID=512294 RepID=UPI0031BADD6A
MGSLPEIENKCMKKKIEIASWPRRSHYEYFQTFDCPMFSITSPVRVDALYRYAKEAGISFFVLCLFVLLKALNGVPQLRQRVEEGEVWEYEFVDALVPVLAADGEFTQILVEYRDDLSAFLDHALPLIQAAKEAPAQANPCHRTDIAVFSCLPWIPFTQVASAYRVFRGQYLPLIHWGKMEPDVSGRLMMPVAVQANHVLVDGVHIGNFYKNIDYFCSRF